MAKCAFHRALLLCLFLPGAVYAQVLPFTHYTPDSDRTPLPSADVQQVYQDRLGYIWMVAFSSGLARYDGVTLDLYTTDDGLKDLNVRDVLEDPLGRLWVASEAGLVVSEKPLADYAHDGRIRFTALIGRTPLLDVAMYKNRIAADEQGWLWVGTDGDGIIRYRVDDLQQTTTDTIRTALYDERQNLTVRSIAVRRNGSVWVGLSGGRLLVFDDDAQHFEVFSGNEEPAFHYTAVLYESPSGILWGGENNGRVWRLEEADGKRSIVTVSTELASGLLSITTSQDRMLWIASAGSGLMRMNLHDTSDRIVYTRRNGLLSETLRHVMQDREGNIWVGQSAGVSKLRFNYRAFESITATSYAGETPMLPASSINAVVLTPQRTDVCRLWVGTSEGLVCIRENGESEYVQDVQGLRNNLVYAMTLDQAGRLWLGTDAGINGLALHTPALFPPAPESRTFTLLGGTARVAGYRGTTIVAAANMPMPRDEGDPVGIESLWFPGYKSLYGLVNDTWFVFRASSGLPPTWYHAVAYDNEGRLWVGTRDHGLYRSTAPLTVAALRNMAMVDVPFVLGNRRGRFGSEVTAPVFEQVWSTSNGAPTNQIESLIWRDGVLWVGTPEGLVTLEGTSPRMTTHLTRQEGLKANNAMNMAFSPVTGSLWVATNGGLAEIDPQSREVMQTVTKQDGLLDNEVWWYGSLAIGDDGTVYFGTAKGLALYRPHEDKTNGVEPLLHVKAVHYSEDGTGNNEFAIEYAALSYANEKQVLYKTRLVGYDADWSPENADVKIRYTNLPALFTTKTYHLEVLARNNDGLWTQEPLTYTFHVQPAWWLRWWAFIVYTALLVTGVVVVNRIHTARLIAKERRKAEMEHARLRAEAAELQARALQAENERNQIELEKARELEVAYQAIQRQAEEIRHKNEENERLLLNILPEPIATRLKQGEEPIADTFSEVTILFSDLVGFTPLSNRISAPELVGMLNTLFSVFDQLAFKHGVEKIKTIGDGYMAVCGLPERREDHAEAMIEMVVEMLEAVEQFNAAYGTQLQVRIGLNTGPVVAGVIGRHKFIYDLWGDAVNTASRMESHGVPGRVHVTREVYEKVKEHFAFESRGEIEVKGKGRMETYLLKPWKEGTPTAAVS